MLIFFVCWLVSCTIYGYVHNDKPKGTLKRKKNMNYLILTETEFFALINETDSGCLPTAYSDFIREVISLCHECTNRNHAAIALAYTENELQHHHAVYATSETPATSEKGMMDLYVRKALAFVRKMQKLLAMPHNAMPYNRLSPQPAPCHTSEEMPVPNLQWTGNTLDLVELIYGLNEMGSINNGETPLKVLAPTLYKIFGLETKECYRYYSAIKLRKNSSRTYFLDKMQAKLNERIRHDEELERLRR